MLKRNPIVNKLIVLFTLLALASCGASQREQTIASVLAATDAARDGFITWDKAHQISIVNGSTSETDAKAKLESYRSSRAKIVEAFEGMYRAIAIAASLNDDTSVANLIKMAELAKQTLDDFMKGGGS